MSQKYRLRQLTHCFGVGSIALGLLTVGLNAQAQSASQQLTPREIARMTLPSVVLIVMTNQASDSVVYGSGFFVKPDVIATNFHVIENAAKGYVRIVGEETKYDIVGVVGMDRSNDLALLKVRGLTRRPLPLEGTIEVAIGDPVFAVGNPKGLEGTFSQGIISSIRRDKQDSLLQITAAISPGSSGGPVLDMSGSVIGVAVGAIESGQSLNFAIPASYLSELTTKAATLVPLSIAGRSGLGEGISARLRPRTVDVHNIRKPSESPRISFKKPDLIDGLPDHRSIGQVSVIEISRHKFVEKFGRWQMTPVWDTEKVIINEFGNIEYEEGFNFKDFMGLEEMLGLPFEASRYKRVYIYDYNKRQVVADLYWAPIAEKIFEYRSRTVDEYRDGKLVESSTYEADGSLQSKVVKSTDPNGRRISTRFNAEGKKTSTDIAHTDSSGTEIEEGYDDTGKMTYANRKSTLSTTDGVIEVGS